jgi:hypothetical protein
LLNLIEIIPAVGDHAQDSIRDQRNRNRFQEIKANDPSLFVSSLLPGIGKQEMEHFHRLPGEQIPDGIGSFDSDDPHVVGRVGFAAGLLGPVEQALETEKIFVRCLFREGEKKDAIATTEVDVQGRDPAEDFRQIERGKV